MDAEGFHRAWRQRHHAEDVDTAANPFLRGYLTLTYRLARPLAEVGASPHVLTAWGLWLAAWVPILTDARERWTFAAAASLVVVSALTDGLDGGVAALTGRASRVGFVLDSVVDRASDGLFLFALVRAGGRVDMAVTAMAAVMALEYSRARAGAAGVDEVGVVTVGERPTRIIAVVFGFGGCAVSPSSLGTIATGTAAAVAVASAVGTAQLWAFIVRRFGEGEGGPAR